VLFEGLLDAELDPFKRVLPFTFSSLSGGFKYLGYHLKTWVQCASDWDWIVTKLTKKMGTWCNRWLSLGGRLILVKSVLEAQSVFWMSFEALPCLVISRIRRVMFHFLLEWSLDEQTLSFMQVGSLSQTKEARGLGFM
jgi:hypothetical protein